MGDTKKKAEQKHAMMRFAERAGIHFSKKTNELFCRMIRSRQAIFLKRSSLRVTLWNIEYKGKLYECVYDKKRKQIVTVLNVGIAPIKKEDDPDYVFKYGKYWKKEKLAHYEKRYSKIFDKLIRGKSEEE